jgi:hypothetical protein
MYIKKRKLIELYKRSEKALNELIKENNLTNKVISVWDIDIELKKKLKYQRTKKDKAIIFPVVKYYSINDKSFKYPCYLYLKNDLKRFEKYLLEKQKNKK